jgi:hypothetical protein
MSNWINEWVDKLEFHTELLKHNKNTVMNLKFIVYNNLMEPKQTIPVVS